MELGIVYADNITILGDGTPKHPLSAVPGASLKASVSLTSAQLLTLGSIPVEIVPAPGAGKTILPLGALYRYKAKTTAYDLSAATSPVLSLQTNPNPSSNNIVAELSNAGTFGVDTLTDSQALFFSEANSLDADAPNENAPLIVTTIDTSASNAGFDMTLGDGTMEVTVIYAIV